MFIDEDVLRNYELVPRSPWRAYVDNYKLHIGERATLWPSAGDRAYGMVCSLTHAELDKLYSRSELKDYRPETVVAIKMDKSASIACLCLNLLTVPSVDEQNHEYAGRLQTASSKGPIDSTKPRIDARMCLVHHIDHLAYARFGHRSDC